MLRATIKKIGIVKDDQPHGWTFDCLRKVPAITIDVTTGKQYWGGYTVEELELLALQGDA